MEHKKYKINEVAKMHNISKKTLIYYDKIGLFKPQYVDEVNNYRYYDMKELPILKQIVYLKKIGFSLMEIKHLLDNREHDLIIDALSSKDNEIVKEIEELQEMHNSIEHLLNFYKRTKYLDKKDLYKPSVKIFTERKIFYLKCEEEANEEEIMLTYRRALRHLQELNLFSHKEYGTIYLKEGIESGFKYNVGSFISIPDKYHIKEETILQEGKYICMYKDGGYYNEDAVKYLLNWIKENGYEVISDIYEYCMIDYTFTKSVEDMISEIQIRVR
ncbi:MerR family transcriptional regulator [uncultured Clostridium sp.]|uniref:MerR family transcriptional regulator n=1 Tax=uncultured Clostridium sp. TaxID=59620 RepID=UPI0028ED2ADC|nr:MerR family transcriptional regulator [uncultured Clostridium sp.]